MTELRQRIRAAWQGRITGCQLGKPVERLGMRSPEDLQTYLRDAGALPLRDYVPAVEGSEVARDGLATCRGHIQRAEPDDDINYTVLSLLLLEQHGLELRTLDVARAWLRLLPAGMTFTAEYAAYTTLLTRGHPFFASGAELGFDVTECADNRFNDWIGAQIRVDLYGWVCPGRPDLAADLARRDAELSHRGDGVYGAMFVAALGAALPDATSLEDAIDRALVEIPKDSGAAAAIQLGRERAGDSQGDAAIRAHYTGLSPVHTINNLALVVWSLLSHPRDFGAAIGDVVAAGLDTDCNGATVGGLWGLRCSSIPDAWTAPWQGRVGVTLAGHAELQLEELVDRTVAVAERIAAS